MNSILVKSANSSVRTITRKNGEKMHFTEQQAAIETGDDFPRPFRITLDDGQQPYAPGRYYVDPVSFDVGQYGDLAVGRRVKLVPLPAASTKAA